MDIYLYRANLVRIVDGDTVILDINAGFQMWLRGERCRLSGIDAPEIRGPLACEDGHKATEWLQTRLREMSGKLYIRTFKSPDKYGRWLVELLTEKGESINREMVELGLAKEYE